MAIGASGHPPASKAGTHCSVGQRISSPSLRVVAAGHGASPLRREPSRRHDDERNSRPLPTKFAKAMRCSDFDRPRCPRTREYRSLTTDHVICIRVSWRHPPNARVELLRERPRRYVTPIANQYGNGEMDRRQRHNSPFAGSARHPKSAGAFTLANARCSDITTRWTSATSARARMLR